MDNPPEMDCTVCQKQKAKLKPRKSKLMPNSVLWLCTDCLESRKEPRWAVIMVARDPEQGITVVRDYIIKHRYEGDKIRAEEILPTK